MGVRLLHTRRLEGCAPVALDRYERNPDVGAARTLVRRPVLLWKEPPHDEDRTNAGADRPAQRRQDLPRPVCQARIGARAEHRRARHDPRGLRRRRLVGACRRGSAAACPGARTAAPPKSRRQRRSRRQSRSRSPPRLVERPSAPPTSMRPDSAQSIPTPARSPSPTLMVSTLPSTTPARIRAARSRPARSTV